MSEKYKSRILSLVPPHSEVLNLSAEKINPEDITSPDTQNIIDEMLGVARGRQGDPKYPTMVGLAAPQVGLSKRIVVIGINATGNGESPELKEFINPQIIAKSDETEDGREGCFSTSHVCGIVERAKSVTIQAHDREGKVFSHEFKGFSARVAQHEIDHLDGIRFPDLIQDDKKLHWVEEAQFGDYRQNWRNWPENCSRIQWEAIKTKSLSDISLF